MTVFDVSSTTLHVFSRGAVDFLIASLALSAITALASSAVEEFFRARFQRLAVKQWVVALLGDFERRLVDFGPRLEDRNLIEPLLFAWHGVGNRLKSMPDTLYALPPDQLAAQLARRTEGLNRALDPVEEVAPRAMLLIAAWTEEVEARIDELQSRLTRSALVRGYGICAYVALLVGAALFVLARPALPMVREQAYQWMILAGLLAVVSVLLSPLWQALIGRVLRQR
jgi:hypothetical protein